MKYFAETLQGDTNKLGRAVPHRDANFQQNGARSPFSFLTIFSLSQVFRTYRSLRSKAVLTNTLSAYGPWKIGQATLPGG